MFQLWAPTFFLASQSSIPSPRSPKAKFWISSSKLFLKFLFLCVPSSKDILKMTFYRLRRWLSAKVLALQEGRPSLIPRTHIASQA